MSRSINKVTLIGTVGRDPEMRFTPGGSGIANFSMATNESYNDKNTGQRVENTEWHRIVAFGNLAEIIQQYVKKGSKLYIEGKLRTSEWEKDGIKRYSTDIIANEMVMLDRASDGQNSGYANHQQGQAGSPYGATNQTYANQQAPAPQQHQQQKATPPPGYPQGQPLQQGQPQPQAQPQPQPQAQPPHGYRPPSPQNVAYQQPQADVPF